MSVAERIFQQVGILLFKRLPEDTQHSIMSWLSLFFGIAFVIGGIWFFFSKEAMEESGPWVPRWRPLAIGGGVGGAFLLISYLMMNNPPAPKKSYALPPEMGQMREIQRMQNAIQGQRAMEELQRQRLLPPGNR